MNIMGFKLPLNTHNFQLNPQVINKLPSEADLTSTHTHHDHKSTGNSVLSMALSGKIAQHNGSRFTEDLPCVLRAEAVWAGIHSSGNQ